MKNKEVNITLFAQTGKDLLALVRNKEKSSQKQHTLASPGTIEAEIYNIWESLLGHQDFEVNDDFFKVGGNSLKAIQLLSRISSQFLVQLSLTEIFLQPTIAKIGVLISGKKNDKSALSAIIKVKERPHHIPLSYGQERLWFIDQLKGTVQYHVPAVIRLTGNLNKKGLAFALQSVIERHESLRSVIYQEQDNVYQKVIGAQQWELLIVDGSEYGNDSEGLQQYIRRSVHEPFDLSRDYMLRAALICLQEQEHILIVSMHHIASDGWSIPIIVKEVVNLYELYVEGRPSQLAPLALQYADYAIWQRNTQQALVLDNHLDYWKAKLLGVPVLQLPTDFTRPFVQSTSGASARLAIGKELAHQIQLLSHQHGTTLFMTLLAAFKVLLYRYSGQRDIVVGTPIAGRQHKEIEGLIGFFVNTLVLRTEVHQGDSFVSFLARVRQTTIEAYEHQEAPFEKVVEAVVKDRDMSRSPLTQVMFVFANTPENPELVIADVQLSVENYEHTTSSFDITFFLYESPDGLTGSVEYSTDLFNEHTIKRMITHFKELLNSVVNAPEQKVENLSLISTSESQQLLEHFNDTQVEHKNSNSVIEIIEGEVSRVPDGVAVVCGEQSFTYRQVNERVNQLANYLRSKAVKQEMLVPVFMEQGVDMIISILAVLKAGAAYVPVDPDYPLHRISYMLEDTGASVVITNQANRVKLPVSATLDIIEIDSDRTVIDSYPSDNLALHIREDQLAYVIYTSGSTGKPKGVMIEHGSLLNYLLNGQTGYIDTLADTSASYIHLSYSFDASLTAVFMPLLHGRQAVISTKQSLEVFEDSNLLKYAPYDFIKITPSHLNLLQPQFKAFGRGNLTKKLVIGGEALYPGQFDFFVEEGIDVEIINEYGPTEATVGCTTYSFHTLTDKDKIKRSVSIGKPMDNVVIYILDKSNNLVPVGVKGEICIGGAGVGRGYLNQAGLTAEKFISSPFGKGRGERIYKTGDIGSWQQDGNIEYVGRMDDQVKIRGYRVELGEIEHVLQQCASVSQAVVLARNDKQGFNRLVSYYVPEHTAMKSKELELHYQWISNWKELYETAYSQTEGDKNTDPEFNIIGWNDSFTGEAIPAEHMKEWLDDITAVILSQQPGNVLEIGCGTGLIYYQLAGKIKKYIGSDLSLSSISQIKQRITKGYRNYGETQLFTAPAHEVELQEGQQVDTIVLNSIVQYFPGEDYMNTVIANCMNMIKDKGRIIIGDVRDNRLLKLFKGRLRSQKPKDSINIVEFKWALEQDLIIEEELCFSPSYFYALKDIYPKITHITIQWKQGSYVNELSSYRYTVIIYVGIEKEIIVPQWQSWNEVTDKKDIFFKNGHDQNTIALNAVPNPRLWKERLLQQALQDTSVNRVNEITGTFEKEDHETAQINQLLDVARSKGYSQNYYVHADPLKMNILFEIYPSEGFIRQPSEYARYNHDDLKTNVPLFRDISFLLQKDFRKMLHKSLPDYMIPSEFIALRLLPHTTSGKVDRLFLSQREDKMFTDTVNYLSPATELEKILAEIWKDLLHVERVGIEDNFFDLGGHSLLAMRVISAIRKELEVELNIKELFIFPTIRSLGGHIQQLNKGLLLPAIEVADPEPDLIPLSFSQERMWFIHQLDGSLQYHMPSVLRLKGNLTITALSAAMQQIINRHEVLRTVFYEENGQSYQYIKEIDSWQLTVIDGSVYKEDIIGLQQRISQLIDVPFDLARDYMLRAALITLDDHDHVLLVTLHHIACDGWSINILVSELTEIYNAYVENRNNTLASLPVQYADYAIWQRKYLQGEAWDSKCKYWKEKLEGIEALKLPTDFPRPSAQTTNGKIIEFVLDKELSDQLQSLSHLHGATLFMTLLAALHVLLCRYSSQSDICIGTPAAGRQTHELDGLIGFFVNTLVLRIKLPGDPLFVDLLQQVKITTLEAYMHQEVPFEKVVEMAAKERDRSRSPLFQVVLAMQYTPEVSELRVGELQLSPAGTELSQHTTSKFDLTFLVTETEQGLHLSVEYCTDLFEEQTIVQMTIHFKNLLKSIVKNPRQNISALHLLTEAETHHLLIELNSTEKKLLSDRSVIEIIEGEVSRVPDGVAVVCGEQSFTYRQVNERVNQLANYLRSKAVKQEMLVPVFMEQGVDMIISILAVLKAGAAYVPVDPDYPLHRISYMLEDTGASVVITNQANRVKLPVSATLDIIEIDSDRTVIDSYPSDNLALHIREDQLAYVIYTSGSTGKPKGVMIEHGSLLNYLLNGQTGYIDTLADTSASYIHLSYSFDASLTAVFMPLLHGRQAVISTKQSLEVFEDSNLLKYAPYDFIKITPSHLNLLQPQFKAFGRGNLTKKLVIGGEALYPGQFDFFVEEGIDVEIINEYGPTEATVGCTTYSFHTLTDKDKIKRSVSIGKPMDNVVIYILDKSNNLVPVGVKGEICIGGAGVGRGYLNQAGLTAEKFISSPFGKGRGERIYKTGDIGSWQQDGNIEYVGRMDDQVKIRGYRVELGEIEHVLQQCASVSQAVVLARNDKQGFNRLVSYYVDEGSFNKDVVMHHLKSKLPEFMIPASWVEMKSFPLTNNGKIDKKALPELDASVLINNQYVAPRTEVEEKLADIWKDLLQAEQIGVYDDFFELGGHSLLAMRMVAYIESSFFVSVPIKVLFNFTCISDLSKYLETQITELPEENFTSYKLYDI